MSYLEAVVLVSPLVMHLTHGTLCRYVKKLYSLQSKMYTVSNRQAVRVQVPRCSQHMLSKMAWVVVVESAHVCNCRNRQETLFLYGVHMLKITGQSPLPLYNVIDYRSKFLHKQCHPFCLWKEIIRLDKVWGRSDNRNISRQDMVIIMVDNCYVQPHGVRQSLKLWMMWLVNSNSFVSEGPQ